MVARPLVSLVDDDESMRESLPHLLWEFGFATSVFSSAEEFLDSDCLSRVGCLILDISLPGMTGPDLQTELRSKQHHIPIIFVTAYEDENMFSRLLQRGAIACLLKPFSDEDLRKAIDAAFRAA